MKKTPSDLTKYQKFYTQETFLQKVAKIARKAGEKVVYLALILYYELTDGSVPVKAKAVIIGALGYLLLPLDMVPDFIPFIGYADDFAALVAAFKTIYDNVTPQVRARAAATASKWFGDVDYQVLDDEINDAIDDQTDRDN